MTWNGRPPGWTLPTGGGTGPGGTQNTIHAPTIVRTNLCANPSFELGLEGWEASDPAGLDRVLNDLDRGSAWVAEVTNPAEPGADPVALSWLLDDVSPQQVYGIALDLTDVTAVTGGEDPAGEFTLTVTDLDENGAELRTSTILTVQPPTDWDRLATGYVIPTANAGDDPEAPEAPEVAGIRFTLTDTRPGAVWRIDAVLIEQLGSAADIPDYTGPYFDGDTPDAQFVFHTWTGEPGASTSVQRTQPAGRNSGDIWFDLGDGNRLYLFNGTAWVDVRDTGISIAEAVADALAAITENNAEMITLISENVENAELLARSAHDVATAVDGRISISDYEPAPEDAEDKYEGSLWFTRTRARLNLCTNPSFEQGTDDWEADGCFLDRAEVEPDEAVTGSWVGKVTNDHGVDEDDPGTIVWTPPPEEEPEEPEPGDEPDEPPEDPEEPEDPEDPEEPETLALAAASDELEDPEDPEPEEPDEPDEPGPDEPDEPEPEPGESGGRTFTASGYVRLAAGVGTGTYAFLDFVDDQGDLAGRLVGDPVDLTTDGYQRVSVRGALPEGADALAAVGFANPNPDDVWCPDGILIEEAAAVGRYFDGRSFDADWNGDPDVSTSTMVGGKIQALFELDDGGWVPKIFHGDTVVDIDASTITRGTMSGGFIADNSIPPDKTLMPPVMVAEDLTAGDLVNVYTDPEDELAAEMSLARKASAAERGREAHGFVLADAGTGEAVPVYVTGYNPYADGLVAGTVYLSATPGLATSEFPDPDEGGVVIQRVGFAADPAVYDVAIDRPITID